MSAYLYHIGIDVSKDSFDAAAFTSTSEPCFGLGAFNNTKKGIAKFHKHLKTQNIMTNNSIFCIEVTGVYSELLCYQLHKFGYQVCYETPLKVKRAFKIKAHKTDSVDAQQIAEYAFRYCDQMIRWHPKAKLIKHLDSWLVLREQLVKQQTAIRNFNKSIDKKIDSAPMACKMGKDILEYLQNNIKQIEDQMNDLVLKDKKLAEKVEILTSIPGIGKLTAINLAALLTDKPELSNYKKAAAYIGICPYRCESGTSLRKPARISHLGPTRLRKLLHLCARSACVHKDPYKSYYQRKLKNGKPKKLAINNVANKLLRVACALIESNKPFIENYQPSHPKFD